MNSKADIISCSEISDPEMLVCDPLVSVVMITYNHERFIAQAIEGVLRQRTTFPVELIIGEDCSIDCTREIASMYQKKNAEQIRILAPEANIGISENFILSLAAARGKYIALCEGDDYWTDSFKLQKQAEFLEKNPEYSLCFHSVMIEDLFVSISTAEVPAEDREYGIDEILLTKTAHTASFFFRKEFVIESIFNNEIIFGRDLVLALMLADQGKVYGISDCMGVYRKHPNGITHIRSIANGIKYNINLINQFIFIRKTFKKISSKASGIKISDHCMTVFLHYIKHWKFSGFKYLFMAFYYRPELVYKGFVKIFKWGNA